MFLTPECYKRFLCLSTFWKEEELLCLNIKLYAVIICQSQDMFNLNFKLKEDAKSTCQISPHRLKPNLHQTFVWVLETYWSTPGIIMSLESKKMAIEVRAVLHFLYFMITLFSMRHVL